MRAPPSFPTTEWRFLAMLNYRVAPDLLRLYVPAGTSLDTWLGAASVGVVGVLRRGITHQRLAMHTPHHRLDVARMQAVLAGTDDPEIVRCEAELRDAQLHADVAALDRLIADELLFTGPDGRLGSKAEDLAAHASGAVRIRAHEPEELRVRRVGADVAVAALRARLAVEVAGALVEGTYRYTRIWAREASGAWRVVGGHVSAVATGAG